MSNQRHVILGVTASIAAYKSAEIIRQLSKEGIKVSVVMTKDSEFFITPLTLFTLADGRVYRDMFNDRRYPTTITHINLAEEADLLLIAPATANIIGKIASGIADDLLTCIAMATRAKILIVPAMNTGMYENPIFKENCAKLVKHGIRFISPIEGSLACGKIGKGHIAEVRDIVTTVLNELAVKDN